MNFQPTDYRIDKTKNKKRAYGGSFSNPFGGIPSMTFDEHLLTYDEVEQRLFINQTGSFAVNFIDPNKPLELRNPQDDSVIPLDAFIAKITAQGVITDMDFYIFMYSVGRRGQIERDAAL